MKIKKTLISNPPYNMKWEIPPFAQIQPRFSKCYVVPPANNANYAFVLTGLEKNDRCVFLLPAAIMSSNQKEEKAIREWLVEENLVEAVIICPDNMFESTGVGTCIIVLDKNKEHVTTEMIDIRNRYVEEIRDQKGQYGGTSHTNRIYQKKIKVIPEKIMEDVLDAIRERKSIPDFCKSVSIEKIKEDKYSLLASHYLDIQEEEVKHRSYEDIVEDLNRVVREKNACKLTINESLAKGMGFDIEMYKNDHNKYAGEKAIAIAFKGVSDYGYNIHIDKVEINETSGVESVENGNIQVSAANGTVYVTAAEEVTARIYNTLGQLIAEKEGTEMQFNLQSGIYIIQSKNFIKKVTVR